MNKFTHFFTTYTTFLFSCTLYAAEIKNDDPDNQTSHDTSNQDEFCLIEKDSIPKDPVKVDKTSKSIKNQVVEPNQETQELKKNVAQLQKQLIKQKKEIEKLKNSCQYRPLYDLTNKIFHPIKFYRGQLGSFSSDSKMLAIISNYSIHIYDITTYKQLQEIKVDMGSNFFGFYDLQSLAFSPNGQYLACTTNYRTLYIYKTTNYELFKTIQLDSYTYQNFVFSPNSQWLAVPGTNQIYIYDTSTYKKTKTLQQNGSIYQLVFSPNNQHLAVAADRKIHLYDTTTYKNLKALQIISSPSSIAFSHDSKRLACTRGLTVHIINISTQKEEYVYLNGQYSTQRVAYSPNGKLIASGGYEQKINIFDMSMGTYNLLKIGVGHTGTQINNLCFSPNSKYLASASNDNTVRLWDTSNLAIQ